MTNGIKDKVAILGMGCSKFGERWDMDAEDLMVEAFQECIEDAGIEKDKIQAAWLGVAIGSVNVGLGGLSLPMTLRLPNIPVTRVENFCATGTEAFRGAVYTVASGAAESRNFVRQSVPIVHFMTRSPTADIFRESTLTW